MTIPPPRCRFVLLFLLQITRLSLSLAALTSPSSTTDATTTTNLSYEQARFVRTKFGHEAAQPLHYNILLQQYNKKTQNDDSNEICQNQIDLSAATRIASSPSSPQNHNLACPLHSYSHIEKLREVLNHSRYNKHYINSIFGIAENSVYAYSAGPIYIKPTCAGGAKCTVLPLDLEMKEGEEDWEVSLRCLVTLFLLGFAVPKSILSKSLLGGEETIQLLQKLGLAFPDTIDSDLIVPYVSLFPMNVDVIPNNNEEEEEEKQQMQESIVLVTDWHPSVLSRTTVGGGKGGKEEDGAVMYIGPDSLSLVRNLPLSTYLNCRCKALNKSGDNEVGGLQVGNDGKENCGESTTTRDHQQRNENDPGNTVRILDFCTGSGIQAITTLVALSKTATNPNNITATCVDVNERALRFVKFNALLNGLDCCRVRTIKADLISGRCLPLSDEMDGGKVKQEYIKDADADDTQPNDNLMDVLLSINNVSSESDKSRKQKELFDIILANPPFIPVPPQMPVEINSEEASDSADAVHHSIAQRYGLFSSGGPDGEDVLQAIVALSSSLLRKDGGLLGIVSEFMNPPITTATATTTNDPCPKDINVNDNLCGRLEYWWKERSIKKNNEIDPVSATSISLASSLPTFARGILFTNEHPISASTYATRRADDKTEYDIWENHLERMNITCVSPGLLFVQTVEVTDEKDRSKDSGVHELKLHHALVPKCRTGSIWTPHNQNAAAFMRDRWSRLIET